MSEQPQAPDAAALAARLDAIERQLAALRALAVRAYERTPALATRLLERRREPGWQRAWEPDPPVTVRIGAYRGGEPLFERALRSVRAQTHPRWEAVVVCDGPEPETAARVAALGDPRIRCVQRPRNGPYPSDPRARWQVAGVHPFNEGAGLARGAWIAPIDQDDEWDDDHLAVLLARARKGRAELVYGRLRARVAGEGEASIGAWPPAEGDFGFQAAIYHADLVDFLYDANAHLAGEPADWNLARRMLEAGVRFDFLDRAVATYHVEPRDPDARAWWRARVAERGVADRATTTPTS
jgi:glycosyltransferase involved in cell wall biosynthesis